MFGKTKRKQDPRGRFVAVAAAIIGGRDDVDRVERVGDMDLVGERDGTEIVRASLSNLWLEVQDRTEQEQD